MKTTRKELSCWGKTGDAVIVTPDKGSKLILWQQAQYVPCWMLTDNVWFTSEWFETGSSEVRHCFEPIMDKECRYNSVDIIDSGPVSATIHWQYALCDNKYRIFRGNSRADEYYTVYPDGMAVRKLVGWAGNMNSFGVNPVAWEVGEFITICGTGAVPSDYLAEKTFTLMNLRGDKVELEWPVDYPGFLTMLCEKHPEINEWSEYIGVLHFKKGPDVFVAISGNHNLFPAHECSSCGQRHPQFKVFSGYSTYSHWPANPNTLFQGSSPVSTEKEAENSPTHTSLMCFGYDYAGYTPPAPTIWSFLTGTVTESEDVKDYVRSWLHPAEIETDHFYEGYYYTDRTYNIRVLEQEECQLKFKSHNEIKNPVICFDKPYPLKEVSQSGIELNKGDYRTQINGKGERLLWLEGTVSDDTRFTFKFDIDQ